ncbi:DUF6303 family protein [Streptomyces sp. NPDC059708]|uniref:DUF6303 family protein n=1 Tax=Streptomyces sp. NPDC059708 TaxID=3346916 RepID=UPI00367629C9
MPARAHLVNRDGRWRLFVALLARGRNWPTHYFEGPVAPTVHERSRVLTGLGYALTDDSEWVWVEDSEQVDDPASPVVLIAHTPVSAIVGGGS